MADEDQFDYLPLEDTRTGLTNLFRNEKILKQLRLLLVLQLFLTLLLASAMLGSAGLAYRVYVQESQGRMKPVLELIEKAPGIMGSIDDFADVVNAAMPYLHGLKKCFRAADAVCGTFNATYGKHGGASESQRGGASFV